MPTFSVTVETTFSAIHRVKLPDGSLEPAHGHDWLVRATFASPQLDASAMVVDFEIVKSALESIAAELHHRNLNDHAAFEAKPPTAENVAKHFFTALAHAELGNLRRVDVVEAPGCVASFEP